MNQLTIEQLKSLEVGEWIWCVHIGDPICNEYLQKSCVSDGERFGIMNLPYGDHLDYSDYGTKWVAYKNKEDVNRGTCEFCIHNMHKGCYNNGVNEPRCEYMNLYLRADEYCTRFETECRLAELTKE